MIRNIFFTKHDFTPSNIDMDEYKRVDFFLAMKRINFRSCWKKVAPIVARYNEQFRPTTNNKEYNHVRVSVMAS